MPDRKIPSIPLTEPFQVGPTYRELRNRINKKNNFIKENKPTDINELISLEIIKVEELLGFLANAIDGTKPPSL